MERGHGFEPSSLAWKAKPYPSRYPALVGSQEFVIHALEKANWCPAEDFSPTRLNGGLVGSQTRRKSVQGNFASRSTSPLLESGFSRTQQNSLKSISTYNTDL
jgi:hypothetical protein